VREKDGRDDWCWVRIEEIHIDGKDRGTRRRYFHDYARSSFFGPMTTVLAHEFTYSAAIIVSATLLVC
jgi:hypothetical protein